MLMHRCFNKLYNWNSKGLFEGDDSIFTDPQGIITHDPWTALGLITKLESHQTLNTTSFCGNVFADVDLKTVTDPIPKLLGFAWMPVKYRSSSEAYKTQLLRAKALSLKVSYPDHPILSSFSNRIIHLTRNMRIRKSVYETQGYWEKMIHEQQLRKPHLVDHIDKPGMQTRLLVEELFGMTLPMQERLEAKFSTMTELCPQKLESWIIRPCDKTDTFARNWQWYVEDDVGQSTIQPLLDLSRAGLEGLAPLSRRLDGRADRSILPTSYIEEEKYAPFETIKTTLKTMKDEVYSMKKDFIKNRKSESNKNKNKNK
jgi:hypothetical protein